VPRADARGRITSHRARSTIASQLCNAKEPMTLFELQGWLGHRSPQSTQHYMQITPTRLVQAYADAGYFSRNLRTIDVSIDREAAATGAAVAGAAKRTSWVASPLRGRGCAAWRLPTPVLVGSKAARRSAR
jgi:hypothetical protein